MKVTEEIFEDCKTWICDDLGYDEFSEVRLQVCEQAEKDHEKKERWYAHTGHLPDTICVCEAIEDLDEDIIYGIMMHEFGHLFCERYPRKGGRNTDANANKASKKYFHTPIYITDDGLKLEFIDLPLGGEEEDGDETFGSGRYDPGPKVYEPEILKPEDRLPGNIKDIGMY